MHDLKTLTENVDKYKAKLKNRGFDESILDQIISLNNDRKTLTQTVETNRAEIKNLSKEVGALKKEGKDASAIMDQVAKLKEGIKDQEVELENKKNELDELALNIPNIPMDGTPVGKDESLNVKIHSWGEPKKFDFKVKDHVTLGEDLGMLDFEAAAKITGARFVVYKGLLARLERAIANYMINFHLDRGYEEIIPPFLVHARSLYGTGNLPKFGEDLFKIENSEWYLIPTAEVPVTNLKREQIIPNEEFPFKYVAYTPCFRSEAGSHGKDTRGLIRMHQFNKVEMVQITHPNQSKEAHAEMIKSGQDILEELNLPYQSMQLCEGDMGFSATSTVDLEVWLPSQDKYREISSISNCWDFQARRAGIRFRTDQGKPAFAHTLNGSGLAVGRTLVAIMENYQNADGSITVPEKLVPYMGGVEVIK